MDDVYFFLCRRYFDYAFWWHVWIGAIPIEQLFGFSLDLAFGHYCLVINFRRFKIRTIKSPQSNFATRKLFDA
jgi:hypothetical protein